MPNSRAGPPTHSGADDTFVEGEGEEGEGVRVRERDGSDAGVSNSRSNLNTVC